MNEKFTAVEPNGICEELQKWVLRHYDPDACSYTVERSMGNYDDVFFDGDDHGTSWAAYQVGRILGMDLPAPVPYDEE